MQREPGELPAGQASDPDILDDDSIHPQRFEPGKRVPKPRHLVFPDYGIDRDIEPPSAIGGELADPPQLVEAEVLRCRPRGELLEP